VGTAPQQGVPEIQTLFHPKKGATLREFGKEFPPPLNPQEALQVPRVDPPKDGVPNPTTRVNPNTNLMGAIGPQKNRKPRFIAQTSSKYLNMGN